MDAITSAHGAKWTPKLPQETTSEQIELTRTKLAQWVINYLGASSRWSASCQLQT
jgi:hypothetical protein